MSTKRVTHYCHYSSRLYNHISSFLEECTVETVSLATLMDSRLRLIGSHKFRAFYSIKRSELIFSYGSVLGQVTRLSGVDCRYKCVNFNHIIALLLAIFMSIFGNGVVHKFSYRLQ